MTRALLAILFGLTAAAYADELSVTFNPSIQSGSPGQMLAFSGTLTNNTTDTLFINSDSFTFPIVGALDDSPFLNNAPISLGPSATSSAFVFFDIDIPALQASGAYDGTFTVLGGTDGSQLNNLGTGSFEVDVTASTPEPSSLLLMGTALVLLLWRVRARTRCAT